MRLSEIKEKIFNDSNYPMGLNYSTKVEIVDGVEVETKDENWLRHWNNEERIAVSVHKDLLPTIKDATNLNIQMEQKVTDKGSFTSYRIIGYTSVVTI